MREIPGLEEEVMALLPVGTLQHHVDGSNFALCLDEFPSQGAEILEGTQEYHSEVMIAK